MDVFIFKLGELWTAIGQTRGSLFCEGNLAISARGRFLLVLKVWEDALLYLLLLGIQIIVRGVLMQCNSNARRSGCRFRMGIFL